MGWNNPAIPWSELERKLSDARRPGGTELDGGRTPSCMLTPISVSSMGPVRPSSSWRRPPGWAYTGSR